MTISVTEYRSSDLSKAFLQNQKYPGNLKLYGLTPEMILPLYKDISEKEKEEHANSNAKSIMTFLAEQ